MAEDVTIGLAIIAQNEAVHIPAAIAQFYPVVHDIVVVDGGSTDNTVEWSQRMGARVVNRPFKNDFADQKNFAMEQLDTDWIYLHDPDERLEPPLIEILPYLVTKAGQVFLHEAGILPSREEVFDCFGIARKNFIDGLLVEPYPDYQYRLFTRNCRYKGAVHEEIINFEYRTEIDCDRDSKEDPSRFNILHYKSSTRQEAQNTLYSKIEKGEV
jgi:glycosyltransferase involved in cell wall biosynthesis